jgi:PRTRC genetic system protein B
MNTCVSIGSSQEFRLSRVLLVYGKSSYDGFPYRHPFVTLHEVIHVGEEAHLGTGHLVTPQMLSQLMNELGESTPREILPERVLVRTADTIVWWKPAGQAVMFFSDRGGDDILIRLNGKRYPHPPLLFKVNGSNLWIRALGANLRPTGKSPLYLAPYWNCYDNGSVCTGTMKIPREKSVTAIEDWEQSFFRSEFTHAGGAGKRTRYPAGLLAMWQTLQSKAQFPAGYLVKVKQTVGEFVSNHETQTQNENRAR